MQVSVIIPVYNAAEFLEQSVLSALQQEETKEVILIEDGSPDDCLAICKRLSSEYPRVQLFQHPNGENRGAGASRNLGIKKAKFPFIAFLDADDFFLENRFEQTKNVFAQRSDAGGVYEAVGRLFENEEVKQNYKRLYTDDRLITMEENIPPTQLFEELFLAEKGFFSIDGLVVKRKILQNMELFDTAFIQAQDVDFMLRLSILTPLYPGNLKEPVTMARIHGNNRVLKEKEAASFRFQLVKKWFLMVEKNQWSRRLNRHITKSFLYYHPVLRHFRQPAIVRIPVKGIALLFLVLTHPKLLSKLL